MVVLVLVVMGVLYGKRTVFLIPGLGPEPHAHTELDTYPSLPYLFPSLQYHTKDPGECAMKLGQAMFCIPRPSRPWHPEPTREHGHRNVPGK